MPTIQGTAGVPSAGRIGPSGPLAAIPPSGCSVPRPGGILRTLLSGGQGITPPRAIMLKDNLFQKIIDRQIPADIVYEDDRALAFRDINPQAPVHVLIIPRKVIPTHADVATTDGELLGHLHLVAVKLAKQLGIDDGY